MDSFIRSAALLKIVMVVTLTSPFEVFSNFPCRLARRGADAPASYSSAQRISWAPVHELSYGMSMSLYDCFRLPAGVLYWVVLPLHQIFKILFSSGFLAYPLVQYTLHLGSLCNRHLLLPLDRWFFRPCTLVGV
jgi:hypothetical protein